MKKKKNNKKKNKYAEGNGFKNGTMALEQHVIYL